ncbi:MAG: hypothetical protein QOH88_3107 [Verrucomicrobiota bacterium]
MRASTNTRTFRAERDRLDRKTCCIRSAVSKPVVAPHAAAEQRIIAGEAREVSRRGARPEEAGSLRVWPRVSSNSRAVALLLLLTGGVTVRGVRAAMDIIARYCCSAGRFFTSFLSNERWSYRYPRSLTVGAFPLLEAIFPPGSSDSENAAYLLLVPNGIAIGRDLNRRFQCESSTQTLLKSP